MKRGVLDLAGLSIAAVFGIFLALLGALTQSVWIPALVGVLTYMALMIRDGLVEVRL